MTFVAYPKTPRLNKPVVVTEKIDGTNAQVFITEDDDLPLGPPYTFVDGYAICAGSRKRWITPDDDNFGFARWVHEHAEELAGLGPGRHFGEWWGSGIQRGYGLTKGENRFSLFNVGKWRDVHGTNPTYEYDFPEVEAAPECCHVVPLLAVDPRFTDQGVKGALRYLTMHGSAAAPGFGSPEGIVVYHTAARQSFKVLLEGDDSPKSAADSSVSRPAPWPVTA